MPATVLETVVVQAMAQQQKSKPQRSHLRRLRLAQSLGSGPIQRAHPKMLMRILLSMQRCRR